MSKITLEFNLPDEDTEFETAVNGKHLATILWDVDQWLRSEQKYNERESIPVDELRDKLREMLYEAGMTWECVIWK
jgi:hypothetical protein